MHLTLAAERNDLISYQRSLIKLLDYVEIDECTKEQKEDIKPVYKLLSLITSAIQENKPGQVPEGPSSTQSTINHPFQ